MAACHLSVRVIWMACLMMVAATSVAAVAAASVKYNVDYKIYHTLERYEADIAALAADTSLSSIVKVNSDARSVENRPIHTIHLTNHRRPLLVQPASAQYKLLQQSSRRSLLQSPEHHAHSRPAKLITKPRILVLFGEHARELVVVESFFMLLRNITDGFKMPCHTPEGHFARFVLNHVDLHMIGLLNPDGKAHMESSGEYCWRGNARGVDLNRNADWQFGGPGSSDKPGTEEYNGGKPFSEPESLLVKQLAETYHYDAYINIHSGEQQVFVPFVDTKSKQTGARRESTDEELKLASNIVASSSNWFRNFGIAYEMNSYAADGAIFDWMAGVMKVPYVICAEIWGDGQTAPCFEQFNPRSDRLHDDLKRIHPLYVTTILHMIETLTGVVYTGPPATPHDANHSILNELCEAEEKLDMLFHEFGEV